MAGQKEACKGYRMNLLKSSRKLSSSVSRAALFPGSALLLTLLGWIGLPLHGVAASRDAGGKRDLVVMTRNLYVGADLGAITSLDPLDPLYLQKLAAAVTAVYQTAVVQNDFRVRVTGLVDEIVAAGPDLVGLQEASVFRVQSPGDLVDGGTTPASVVVIDYLQVLIEALAARGAHYAVVSASTNSDVELPMLNPVTGGIDDARLTDQDAILARTGASRNGFPLAAVGCTAPSSRS